MDLHARVTTALRALGVADSDPLGLAVSGGADSMALLHLLAHRAGVHVLHVDHGLRPDSAPDADFVARAAESLGLPCSILRPVVDIAPGDSVEAAARAARYAAFGREADTLGLRFVATAHTRDDQAETVLLNVMRGTHAAGIAPVRGMFVRPLLDVRRQELRAYLTDRNLRWREDPTNADTRFERNWVRHELMPVLAARRPGVSKALARLGSHARADTELLDALAADVLSRAPSDTRGLLLPHEEMAALPSPIASRVVRLALRSLDADPTSTSVDEILRSEAARCGHVLARRLPEGIALVRTDEAPPEPLDLDADLCEARTWGIRLRVGDPAPAPWRWRTPLPPGRISVRSRRPGDRVKTPAGTRKLQDVLVDAKVPRELRDVVGVVVVEGSPVAAVGLTRWPNDAPRAPEAPRVLDAEPYDPTWSQAILWNRASA